MKKISLLIAIAIAPISAYAFVPPHASATISNIGYEVISGLAPEINENGFYADASATDLYKFLVISDYSSSTGTPFSVYANAADFAYAEANNTHAKSVSYGTQFDQTNSMATSNYAYHYKGGSLLHFFADVSLEGVPGVAPDSSFYTFNNSSTSLSVNASDGTLKSFASYAYSDFAFLKNSTLDLYIYSPFDKELTFTVQVSSGSSPSIPDVPEPETYGMMLVGIGLMGFVAKHKRA